jgi:hypothetical protein
MKHKFLEEEQQRRYLVCHRLGGMEVAHIKAEHNFILNSPGQIKIVRSDHEALRTQTEQLALDAILEVLWWVLHFVDFVKTLDQKFPVAEPSHGHVLGTVGNPEVVNTRAAHFPTYPRRYLPAAFYMRDPEMTDALVKVTQSEAGIGHRMGEKGGIKVESRRMFMCPIHPTGEVFVSDLSAVHPLSSEIPIARVEVQAMSARDEGIGDLEVGP